MVARPTQRRVKTDAWAQAAAAPESVLLAQEESAADKKWLCVRWFGWRSVIALVAFLVYASQQLESTRQTAVGQSVAAVSSTVVSGVTSVALAVSASVPDRFQWFSGLAIVTVASHQKVSASAGVEYGELKSAFV